MTAPAPSLHSEPFLTRRTFSSLWPITEKPTQEPSTSSTPEKLNPHGNEERQQAIRRSSTDPHTSSNTKNDRIFETRRAKTGLSSTQSSIKRSNTGDRLSLLRRLLHGRRTGGDPPPVQGPSRHSTIDTKNSESFEQSKPWDQKAVLSLDGGGIRGYSALLIIGELMKKIKHIEQNMPPGPDPWDGPAHSSYHPVDPDQEMSTDSDDSASDSASKMAESSAFLPCHYFDYIAGTSTGGLISIMLGRLRMSVDECIEEYRALGDEVFGKRRIFHLRSIPPIWLPREKYNHKNLEAVIQDLVKRKVPKIGRFPGGRNFEFDENRCRVVVVAYQENPESGTEQTYLFRTYKNLRKPSDPGQAILYRNPGPADDIEIWKVARATSAAPSYFKEMTIEDLKYLDGGFGANNPCLEIYQEILNINNDNENCLGCILSIGTGKNDEKRLQSQAGFRESLKLGLGKYIRFENFARKWASESEAPHRAMLSNWRKSNEAFKYCRLNVVDGLARMKLDEWRRRSSARLAIGRNIGRCNRRMKSKKSLPQSAKDAQQLKLRRMKHEDDNESNATDSIAANDASDPKEELEKFIPDSYKPLNKTIETITKLTETYLAQQDCQDELDQIASHLVESRRARVRANPDRWQKTCFRTWYQCQVRGCPRGESEYPDAHAMRKHLLDKHKDKFSKHDDQAIQNLNKTILNFKITVR